MAGPIFDEPGGLTPRGPGGAASGQGFEIFLGLLLLEVLRPARRLRLELGVAGSVVGTVLDQQARDRELARCRRMVQGGGAGGVDQLRASAIRVTRSACRSRSPGSAASIDRIVASSAASAASTNCIASSSRGCTRTYEPRRRADVTGPPVAPGAGGGSGPAIGRTRAWLVTALSTARRHSAKRAVRAPADLLPENGAGQNGCGPDQTLFELTARTSPT
jgi:hypothetical protein